MISKIFFSIFVFYWTGSIFFYSGLDMRLTTIPPEWQRDLIGRKCSTLGYIFGTTYSLVYTVEESEMNKMNRPISLNYLIAHCCSIELYKPSEECVFWGLNFILVLTSFMSSMCVQIGAKGIEIKNKNKYWSLIILRQKNDRDVWTGKITHY